MAYGDSCSYQCTSGSDSTHIVPCEANGVFEASFDCSFQCENGGILHPNKDVCKCPKGFFGRKCENSFDDASFAANYALDVPDVASRRRLKRSGPLDKDDDQNHLSLSSNKLVRLSKGSPIGQFDVYAIDNKVEASLDALFPTVEFKSILRFEPVDEDTWTADDNDPLVVHQQAPDGYNPSSSLPIFGVFMNRTSGLLEKHDTSYDTDAHEIVYKIYHFSDHGTAEFPSDCGNGQVEQNEVCDDGNTDPLDGCSSSCTIETGYHCPTAGNFNTASQCETKCGDGFVNVTEQCDTSDAGCSSSCTIEVGYYCDADGLNCNVCADCPVGQFRSGCGNYDQGTCTECTQATGTQYYTSNGGLTDSCSTASCDARASSECDTNGEYLGGCGNGAPGACANCTGGEIGSGARYITTGGQSDSCESGKFNDGDLDPAGWATDGSAFLDAEQCDNEGKNGCLDDGLIHEHYSCVDTGFGSKSVCTPKCGNDIISPDENNVLEECDDANTGDYDGCSSSCTIEIGYTCNVDPCTKSEAGSADMFNTSCGDGLWAKGSSEKCDDGNDNNGDGCESCTIQSGWGCKRDPGQNISTCIIIGKF